MNMPKETLELIQKTAQEAQQARILDLPGDGRTKCVNIADKLNFVTIPPAARDHKVESLEDLAAYACRVAAHNAIEGLADKNPVVWHDDEAVILVIDDTDRRDTVTFALTISRQFGVLRQLRNCPAWLEQRDFINLLRLDLGLDNIGLVDQFRRLDWKASSENQSTIGHGKESLGKSIQAEVQGVEKLPDELDVRVPVFSNPGVDEKYCVACAIEIDTRNQRLCLVPLPCELEKAAGLAQEDIHERLAAAMDEIDVPVYFGAP